MSKAKKPQIDSRKLAHKAERNAKIKTQRVRSDKGNAEEMEFDEESIKSRVVDMLEEYKDQGGVLELGEDDQSVDGSSSPGDDDGGESDASSHADEQGSKATDSKTVNEDRKKQREKKKFDFERNKRTIFIGNLPASYDHHAVTKLFKECGPVESARIRSIVPDKEKLAPKVALITKRIHPKVDSVNAYVVFENNDNDEPVARALSMNGKQVEGHHIRVDRAIMPNVKRMTLTSRKKSIFVGNLRFDIRDDDLINHFKKVGSVSYVRIVRDRATGLGKGFGFVVFDERISVKKALELDGTDFKGRQMRIKKVDAEDKKSKGKKADNKVRKNGNNAHKKGYRPTAEGEEEEAVKSPPKKIHAPRSMQRGEKVNKQGKKNLLKKSMKSKG